MPYCWGCHGSLANFRLRVEAGTMAGNVCTRNAPRTDVAGVDCSAFVSAAWGLSVHYTTAAIPAIAKTVENPWDLKPGDALNKPGSHVMLFLRFTPDRKAEVMEVVDRRLQWPRLSQCLSAGFTFGAWLRPSTVPRPGGGRDDGFGECLSGHGLAERAFEKAGHGKAVNLAAKSQRRMFIRQRPVVQRCGTGRAGTMYPASARGWRRFGRSV